MGEGEPSRGGWRKLWAWLSAAGPVIWKEMSTPAGVALLGIAFTTFAGAWLTERLKEVDAARDAAAQAEKDRKDRIDRIESQLSSSLQERMTYVNLISADLARNDAMDDLRTDWPAYRQQYVIGTASVLLGNLSLQKEMRSLDPAAWPIFSRYMLSYVEPRLEDEDYCLSAARDVYVDAATKPGERAKQAAAVLSSCGRPDLDSLAACVQDIIINIHYAVLLSEAGSDAKPLQLQPGDAAAQPAAKDSFADKLAEKLRDCGPIPSEGS